MRSSKKMAALLALSAGFGVCTLALAEPPSTFGWWGSNWTDRYEFRRFIPTSANAWEPFKPPRSFKGCNSGGGEQGRFCGLTLQDPTDLDYMYEIREYSKSGLLVRVTGCRYVAGCWECQGRSLVKGDDGSYEQVTPYNCGKQGAPR